VSGVNISICDGKYTVIQAPTGTTRVLRYGEEWRDVTGDNVIGGLAWELQEARDRIKMLEEAGDVIKASLQRSLNSNEQGECKWLAELPMTDAEFAVFTTAFKAKEAKL